MTPTNGQPNPIVFEASNYAWLRMTASSHGWSVQSAVSRITQKLQQYKLGKISEGEFLAFVNLL